MIDAARGASVRPLKILLYHTRLPEPGRKVGGAEIAVHRLANALVDLGKDDVTVLSATGAPPDARYRSERILGRFPIVYRRPLPQIVVMPLALNFFDFSRFDVVHLHGDDWFFVKRTTPTLRTLHGSALREAQQATRLRRRAFMYGVYGLELVASRMCRMALAMGRDTAAIYGVTKIVTNGVDEAVFFPGPKSPGPTILFVGLWEGRKRGRFVYETFVRLVLPRVPGAELCMVSDRCPLHPSVKWVHSPDDSTLARLYRDAWVFVSASTYEGFGIPYLEALASGTPIVSTPNPGVDEVLDHGAFGVITDDRGLGDAVVAILGDAERRRALASHGLERAGRYSWRAVARHHRELYLEALATPGASVHAHGR